MLFSQHSASLKVSATHRFPARYELIHQHVSFCCCTHSRSHKWQSLLKKCYSPCTGYNRIPNFLHFPDLDRLKGTPVITCMQGWTSWFSFSLNFHVFRDIQEGIVLHIVPYFFLYLLQGISIRKSIYKKKRIFLISSFFYILAFI